ncbi:amino acid racemase [Halalkalibacterium halodurans]|uniref:aspartate/glutamate racemase family protein n=1 Tax=Halalkalibacterium halodurans TaxID=86665 RepID=UPI0010681F47|nr:amino acid racemase [Halalkalibacterium halodurans]TES56753.1 amino acid racemase [Halalkalibacterium halodurans]
MSPKVIGVLGGMGPAATAELFNRVITNTSVEMDQDHVNMIIINDPQIPDRTNYIFGKGTSPVPRLTENLHKLFYAGADVAVIPCMTAHAFISELKQKSPIPIVNAIELVELHLRDLFSSETRIGLMATDGSVKSGVFEEYISNEIVVPEEKDQKKLMEIIYGENGIKSGNTSYGISVALKELVKKLKKANVKAIIAGCTELSLVMDTEKMGIEVIDPILLLAKHIVNIGSRNAITVDDS